MGDNKKRIELLEDISGTMSSIVDLHRDWKGNIDFDTMDMNEKMMVDIADAIDKLSNVLYDMLEEQAEPSKPKKNHSEAQRVMSDIANDLESPPVTPKAYICMRCGEYEQTKRYEDAKTCRRCKGPVIHYEQMIWRPFFDTAARAEDGDLLRSSSTYLQAIECHGDHLLMWEDGEVVRLNGDDFTKAEWCIIKGGAH